MRCKVWKGKQEKSIRKADFLIVLCYRISREHSLWSFKHIPKTKTSKNSFAEKNSAFRGAKRRNWKFWTVITRMYSRIIFLLNSTSFAGRFSAARLLPSSLAFVLPQGKEWDFISWMIYAMISRNMCDTCVDGNENNEEKEMRIGMLFKLFGWFSPLHRHLV